MAMARVAEVTEKDESTVNTASTRGEWANDRNEVQIPGQTRKRRKYWNVPLRTSNFNNVFPSVGNPNLLVAVPGFK